MAATPAVIVVAFNPVSRHVNEPEAGPQYIDLPAAVAAEPAPAAMAKIWPEGYASVHSKPARGVPGADKERLRRTVPPELVVAEDKLKLAV